MLALRRTSTLRPSLTRHCAFLTKMKAMEVETTKLAATLPDDLKGIAESGTALNAELTKFASERPELFKTIIAKIAEARRARIAPPLLRRAALFFPLAIVLIFPLR